MFMFDDQDRWKGKYTCDEGMGSFIPFSPRKTCV